MVFTSLRSKAHADQSELTVRVLVNIHNPTFTRFETVKSNDFTIHELLKIYMLYLIAARPFPIF